MTVTSMEILGRDGGNSPILPLLRQSRDALARYCEARWPVGRRKAVERAWGLSPDEARGVIEATASAATIDKVWKAGGWAVALPVLSSVIGCSVEDFIHSERRKQLETARNARALVRDLRALRTSDPDPAPGRRAERGGEGGAVHRRRAG